MLRTASNTIQSGNSYNKTLVTILGPNNWRQPTWIAVRQLRLELGALAAQIPEAESSAALEAIAKNLKEFETKVLPSEGDPLGDEPEEERNRYRSLGLRSGAARPGRHPG
jgi:hypothetical protein